MDARPQRKKNREMTMTKIHWMGMAAAAVLLGSTPSSAFAKHGADDLTPDVENEIEHGIEVDLTPGYQLAKHGADDLTPDVENEVEHGIEVDLTPGYQLAKHGRDDFAPEPVFPEPEIEFPGIA